MSFFENEKYLYQDTFFILFETESRPSAAAVHACIDEIDEKYQLEDLKEDNGKFQAVSVRSPHDRSAMDIVYVEGEEVEEQVEELMTEFRSMTLNGDEMDKLSLLKNCRSRLDIYHFEEQTLSGEGDMLDPGGLVLIMEKLSRICVGVGLDPQSKTLL